MDGSATFVAESMSGVLKALSHTIESAARCSDVDCSWVCTEAGSEGGTRG
jgi:hypothetical protein